MSNVRTYYSVSQRQVDALITKFVGKTKGNDDGIYEGTTPFGKVKIQADYHPASGQLVVTVLDKPLVVTMDAIDNKIREHLAAVLSVDPMAAVSNNEVVKPAPVSKQETAKSASSAAPVAPAESPATPPRKGV